MRERVREQYQRFLGKLGVYKNTREEIEDPDDIGLDELLKGYCT